MSDREKLIAEYAWLLGKYGEGSPQDAAFNKAHAAGDPAPLIEVVLMTRALEERAGQ